MGKWLRKDAAIRRHPKFIKAGFFGQNAAEAAWEFAKMHDRDDGEITDIWDTDLIIRWCNLPEDGQDYKPHFKSGMMKAEKVRLIDRRDVVVFIHDWEEMQPNKSTDRVRKH